MELFFKIIGISFIAVTAFMLLKNIQPESGNILILATGALILLLLSDLIVNVLSFFTTIGEKTGINSNILTPLIKIIGIGYLTEYSVSLCSDSGCPSLGKKIELSGKLVILLAALPILREIFDLIESLL